MFAQASHQWLPLPSGQWPAVPQGSPEETVRNGPPMMHGASVGRASMLHLSLLPAIPHQASPAIAGIPSPNPVSLLASLLPLLTSRRLRSMAPSLPRKGEMALMKPPGASCKQQGMAQTKARWLRDPEQRRRGSWCKHVRASPGAFQSQVQDRCPPACSCPVMHAPLPCSTHLQRHPFWRGIYKLQEIAHLFFKLLRNHVDSRCA